MSKDDVEQISACEFCGTAIFPNDKHYSGMDFDLCKNHSPSLRDVINQHVEILAEVPWTGDCLGYDTRDGMKHALAGFKQDLANNGDRSLAQRTS